MSVAGPIYVARGDMVNCNEYEDINLVKYAMMIVEKVFYKRL